MTEKRNYRDEIQAVKAQYMLNAISYAEAIHRCKPILADMNVVMERLCKENKMRFKPLTFSYVFR